MADFQQTKFTIRDDRAVDPKTVVAEGLRIGRFSNSDVWLNHPQVSRLHAGINRVDSDFFLISLSASSATTLNGRAVPFNEIAALARGDEIQIGPFLLHVEETVEGLSIRVSPEFAFNVGDRETTYEHELDSGALRVPTGPLDGTAAEKKQDQTATSAELTNALKVFWGKRTREKAGRPSPLHPRRPPHTGKARFNWTGTRDLIRPWPFAIFIWALVVVATLAAIAAFAHKNAFAPESVSDPHTRNTFTIRPAIAKQANANSCTSCHAMGVSVANKEKMNANCAACHHTESFEATVIPAHRAAGINCVTCHSEHRGQGFRPLNAALESCAKCHNDQNKRAYNGKTVRTPHGGTYGYPVLNGVWIWKGLDSEELAQKPEVLAFLKKNRVNSAHAEEWRNAQFHGIHLNGIRAVPGVDGILDEDGNRVLSCSSCHQTGYMGANVDRSFPRSTCGKCHNAEVFDEPATSRSRVETLSCTSCHVQHVKDLRWTAKLRITGMEAVK
jgi:pSer/pThr/pTyr-binding forkhead associated (FHA) protein